MPDSHRHGASPPVDPDRGEKIEQLLLTGLDHYLGRQYDQAIDVWTRVLFFDRHHARARAYIERARSAQAERLRESEAMLDDGVAALQRGETARARRLITSAVDRGGSSEDALVSLERLNRLEVAQGTKATAPIGGRARLRRPRRRPVTGTTSEHRLRVRWLPLLLVVILGAVSVAMAATWDQWRSLVLPPEVPSVAAPSTSDEPLPIATRAEVALSRARAEFQHGRLRDALRYLDRMPIQDPLRAEADALRATIQRTLLTGVEPGAALDAALPAMDPGGVVP